MKNAINWFEIPVSDFDRAKKFYESILESEFDVFEMKQSGHKMAFFPADLQDGAIGGGIMSGPGYEPSQKGALIYLNGGEDLTHPLSLVEKAGGKVEMPKTAIGENGFMAVFLDTEGNRVAFHSRE